LIKYKVLTVSPILRSAHLRRPVRGWPSWQVAVKDRLRSSGWSHTLSSTFDLMFCTHKKKRKQKSSKWSKKQNNPTFTSNSLKGNGDVQELYTAFGIYNALKRKTTNFQSYTWIKYHHWTHQNRSYP